MSTTGKLHPLLTTLGLKPGHQQDASPTALDVLNHLLQAHSVSPDLVQSAYTALLERPSKHNNPKEARESGSPRKTEATNGEVVVPRTRHIALRVYYDGANYSGLAQNLGQHDDNSVEKALFAALLKTRLVESRETSGYSRCGRTDRGVSAAGQVVALQLKSNLSIDATRDEQGQTPLKEEELPKNSLDRISVWTRPKKAQCNAPRVLQKVTEYPYAKMLNNVLPDSIRILGWCPVSEQFSARFSATTRTYRYFFLRRHLNMEKMREALQLLVGKHDFRNFCKMDVQKVYNFERQIHSAQLMERPEQSVCYFQIVGQAYLWHQIRCIVSVLFLVGRGLEVPTVVTDLLNVSEHPGKPSYPLADERPLVLHNCGYPNLQIGYSGQNLWALSCQMEKQWEELILAAARVRNCLESLCDEPVLRRDMVELVQSKLEDRIKKQNKHKSAKVTQSLMAAFENLEEGLAPDDVLSWGHALKWMDRWGCHPEPNGIKEISHIPLLHRSRGTTYEEKIDALSKSQKRQHKYEENVIKKRKSAEEDAAFYNHMTKQGGTGI